jgi:hypothetical protein
VHERKIKNRLSRDVQLFMQFDDRIMMIAEKKLEQGVIYTWSLVEVT